MRQENENGWMRWKKKRKQQWLRCHHEIQKNEKKQWKSGIWNETRGIVISNEDGDKRGGRNCDGAS